MMILHEPTIDDVLSPHPFFLNPKAKAFKIIEQIWFMKTLVSNPTLLIN